MFKRKHTIKQIDAPIYGYWQALYMAFYSRRLYVDIAKRWKGFGFVYCLLFMTVAVIPLSVKSIIDFNQYVGNDLITPVSKIPKFNIINGRVMFEKPMPYYIKNKNGEDIVIIDTTGHVNRMTDQYPKLVMLITKDNYYFRAPKLLFLKDDNINKEAFYSTRVERFPIKEMQDGVFDAANWVKNSGLIALKNGVLAVIYPFLVSSMFGMFSTLLIVFAMMGQVASYTILKYKLTFKPACRVMMVSSSIGVLIFLCLKAAGLNSHGMTFLCMMVVFCYFCFAVLSVKRESQQLVSY